MTSSTRPERPDESVAPGLFRHVAACLDGSDLSQRVMPHALALTGAMHAPLTLLRVIESRTDEEPPADAVDWEFRRQEAADSLQEIAARCPPHVTVAFEVLEGSAAEQICAWVDGHGVDLTVLTTHGVGGPSGWRISGTARKLVDRVPGSVLVVPSVAAERSVESAYRRVLVPLDGSPRAESVLPLAAQVANAAGAELLMVHVVPPAQLTRIGPLESSAVDLGERIMQRNEAVAREYLDCVRGRWAAQGCATRTLLLRNGDVRSRLERVIHDEKVELVMLSSHGQSGRIDVACGSVTADLLLHSAAPLLMVRPRPASAHFAAAAAAVRAADTPRLPQQALP